MSTPLTIQQHATFERLLRLRQGGVPVALSGYEVLGQVRAIPSGTLAAEFTCTPTGQPGEVTVSLTPGQTGALTTGGRWPAYRYDFVLRRTADDWRKRILYGPVTVTPGVTQ